ncbi:FAD-dependent oxidoreductase [Saccharomonospora sp. NPDC006951]
MQSDEHTRPTVAVIGAGVSGLTAAYLLRGNHRVLLFEAGNRLGGHANTHEVVTGDGSVVGVDSGFIVHNDRTYPQLTRLFSELGVPTQATEMSMSVSCAGCGLEYAGAKRLGGLFAQPGNLARPAYLRLLAQVRTFHRAANRLLDDPRAPGMTVGEFLARGGYSHYFTEHFALPLVSAVWSAGPRISGHYPARYLFEFLRNHGMLSVGGSPQWRSVVGGSRRYVDLLAKNLPFVRTDTPVATVSRGHDGVEVKTVADEVCPVDKVVLATHADDALRLLETPTPAERSVLGAFTYSGNEAVLHTDAGVLPAARGARASWNYAKPGCSANTDRMVISYDMNRLLRLAEPADYVVSLGAAGFDERTVLARTAYRHPVFTPDSVAAARKLPALNTGRTAFAGAYHGWGFHEDGCASGVRAAESFGARW